jgi:uncharacterized membrane protein required for colicin V production
LIPVEVLWLTLTGLFALIGMVRGLSKELGTATILALSLFALKIGWDQIGSQVAEAVPGGLPASQVEALYYISVMVFVAFISYQGIVLQFPMKKQPGVLNSVLGLFGGLLNGYLFIGTVWDAVNRADYFGIEVPFGSGGEMIAISSSLTDLHNTIAQYLPITFVNELFLLVVGIILLLAIVLK